MYWFTMATGSAVIYDHRFPEIWGLPYGYIPLCHDLEDY